ncbi:MAG: hypothetical protein KDD53_06365 [Bdellovibrionales bacterium]|nr:hypothetical protein [Bdellovibrionales bacterium]
MPIGLSDCLNFGSPEKPNGMWQIAEAIRGLGESARAFKTPIVSGNVSLYNETKGAPIFPTPMVASVGLIDDASKAIGAHFLNEGDKVLVVGQTFEELGGTEYMAQFGEVEKGSLPVVDYSLDIRTAEVIRGLIDQRLLVSCHDVSSGGLAIALARCCFDDYSEIGATIEVTEAVRRRDGKDSERPDALMFSETTARYIISCKPQHEELVKEMIERANLAISARGVVGGKLVELKGISSIDLHEAANIWRTGLVNLIN